MIHKSNQAYDPLILPNSFDHEAYKSEKKMNIGYVVCDKEIGADKASKRAVTEAAEALKKKGHKLVEIQLPYLEDVIYNFLKLMVAEGKSRGLVHVLDGEKPMPDVKQGIDMQNLPLPVLKLFGVVTWIIGE
mmetsp:Transcript_10910/g.9410  ORF Transcript_10910/g.9410 Transcript_10910/m.9410 type:complete len:132 (-) Transcript_10910:23-418(-)